MNITTVLWTIIGIMFPLFTLVFVYLVIFWFRLKKAYDRHIDVFIDKQDLYEISFPENISKEKFDYRNGKYVRVKGSSVMSKKGKLLSLYSLGQPTPLDIGYKQADWINSESARSIFNNDSLQKIAAGKNQKQELMMGLIVFCCVINTLLTAAMALKLFGVIK